MKCTVVSLGCSFPTWCGRRGLVTGEEVVSATEGEPPRRGTLCCLTNAYDRRGALYPCSTSSQWRPAYETMNAPLQKHGQSVASNQEKPYCFVLSFDTTLCMSHQRMPQIRAPCFFTVFFKCCVWSDIVIETSFHVCQGCVYEHYVMRTGWWLWTAAEVQISPIFIMQYLWRKGKTYHWLFWVDRWWNITRLNWDAEKYLLGDG